MFLPVIHFCYVIIGVEHDARAAIRYGCQLREILKQKTGEDVYLRPGPYWYRNVAFGKGIYDYLCIVTITLLNDLCIPCEYVDEE